MEVVRDSICHGMARGRRRSGVRILASDSSLESGDEAEKKRVLDPTCSGLLRKRVPWCSAVQRGSAPPLTSDRSTPFFPLRPLDTTRP